MKPITHYPIVLKNVSTREYSLKCIHTHSHKDGNQRKVTKILMLSSELSKFSVFLSGQCKKQEQNLEFLLDFYVFLLCALTR